MLLTMLLCLVGCANKPTATEIRDQAVDLQQNVVAFAQAAQPVVATAGQVAVAVEGATNHQDVQQLTELVTNTVNVANTIVAKTTPPTVDGNIVTGSGIVVATPVANIKTEVVNSTPVK